MRVNKNNYEMYFLDYHEGNLPAEQVAELFLFLETHPELKTEFESFENIALPEAPLISFPEREFLKKGEISENNYTDYFIGHVEGTLSTGEEKLMREFITRNPQLQKELDLFHKTKLPVDLSIVFKDKGSLKKPVPLFGTRRVWYYAAASVLLILSAFLLIQIRPSGPQTVERKDSSPIKVSPQHDDRKTARKLTPSVNEKEEVKKNNEINPVQEPQLAQRTPSIESGNDKIQLLLDSSDKLLREHMELMQPKEITLIAAVLELMPAGHDPENNKSGYYTLTAESRSPDPYITVGDAVRSYSRRQFKSTINNPEMADALLSNKVPGRVKGITFLSWCMQRITGEKVEVNATYNTQGELTAYHLSSGRLKYEKTFASR